MTKLLVLKVLLLGEGGVGKTSLRQKYMGLGFQPIYMATIGADFSVKTIKIGMYDLKFNIWDLAGQPRFREVRGLFYRGSSAAIYVFDLTDSNSLPRLVDWSKEVEINLHSDVRGFPSVVVGNKNDLDRVIPREDGQAFAESMDAPYVETSALTGHNVAQVFEKIGELLIKKAEAEETEGEKVEGQ